MDIRGISGSTIAQLVEKLGVKEPTDLYDLTYEQVASLSGFKDKKISNFLLSIQESKKAELAQFINALGIENIGKKAAKDLAVQYKSIDNLARATVEELASINEVGLITAKCVVDFFAKHGELIRRFKEIGIDPVYQANENVSGSFSGLKVVLTGTLSTMARSQAKKLIEERGGEVLSSVTKETNMLVCGEDAGSKLEKAKKAGIKIVFEEEFLQMLS